MPQLLSRCLRNEPVSKRTACTRSVSSKAPGGRGADEVCFAVVVYPAPAGTPLHPGRKREWLAPPRNELPDDKRETHHHQGHVEARDEPGHPVDKPGKVLPCHDAEDAHNIGCRFRHEYPD